MKTISKKSLPYKFTDNWVWIEADTDCGFWLLFVEALIYATIVLSILMFFVIMPLIVGPFIVYQHHFNDLVVDLGPSNIINLWCWIFVMECILLPTIGGYELIKYLALGEPIKKIIRCLFEPLTWLWNSDTMITSRNWVTSKRDNFCTKIEFED